MHRDNNTTLLTSVYWNFHNVGEEVKRKKLCLHTVIDNVKFWFWWTKSTREINVVDEQHCDFSLILPYLITSFFKEMQGNINSSFLCSGTHSQDGFPDGSDGKQSTYNAGDPGLISGLGRSPGEGNGNPLQYACLENPMDRAIHGVTKCRTQLSS